MFTVEIGKSPLRGAVQPYVTLIAFFDFQGPSCAFANATLDMKRWWRDLDATASRTKLQAEGETAARLGVFGGRGFS